MMTLLSLLGAFFDQRDANQRHLNVVVIRMSREGRAQRAITQDDFDLLVCRLQQVAAQYPTATYDGQEVVGGEVRLYFFADAAEALARALTRALGDVSWCRGAAVGVCSDIGFRLGEYAVP